MTIAFAQIDKARRKARRGLHHRYETDMFGITMWDDDERLQGAHMYLTLERADTAAGHRRYTFVGDQAQVDSYIQAVIGALSDT